VRAVQRESLTAGETLLFDRRPFYLIAGAASLVFGLLFYVLAPKVTPEQRVKEQLALLVRQPWTHVRVDAVERSGSGPTDKAIVRGVRLDTNTPVCIEFIGKNPYTSPSAMQRLGERSFEGQVAEVLMLPRSLTTEPFRSQFQSAATHAGVALFAGFPDRPAPPVPGATPAAAGAMSEATTHSANPQAAPPATPAAAPPGTPAAAPAVATAPPSHG
jgi:hypothetical protein